MQVDKGYINKVLGLIAQYGLGELLSVHLIHNYGLIPDGQVNFEKNLETILGK